MNRIKRARLIRGITQTELAEELGVSVVTVSKWELNRSFPRAKRLKKVADVLHTTVPDLLKDQERRTTDGAAS